MTISWPGSSITFSFSCELSLSDSELAPSSEDVRTQLRKCFVHHQVLRPPRTDVAAYSVPTSGRDGNLDSLMPTEDSSGYSFVRTKKSILDDSVYYYEVCIELRYILCMLVIFLYLKAR